MQFLNSESNFCQMQPSDWLDLFILMQKKKEKKKRKIKLKPQRINKYWKLMQ